MKIVIIDKATKIDMDEKKSFSRDDICEAIADVTYREVIKGKCGDHLAQAFMIFGSKLVEKLFDESEVKNERN